MRRPSKAPIAILLLCCTLFLLSPRPAQADEARGVGYALGFQLGVQDAEAADLVAELAKATSEWLGREVPHGAPVANNCASDQKCVRAVASTMGVTRVGIVTIVAGGGVVRIEVRLMDANTGGEILRTHAEYESTGDFKKAADAIYDLMPRLLPGEKARPTPEKEPETADPLAEDPIVTVPPVAEIPPESTSPAVDLRSKAPPKRATTRWWLWGGLGVAATVAVVTTAILITSDGGNDALVLDLPPPQ